MSKPENAIQNIKERKKEEGELLKEETNQLKEEIKGNPKIVEAIRKLEKRIERLGEKGERARKGDVQGNGTKQRVEALEERLSRIEEVIGL